MKSMIAVIALVFTAASFAALNPNSSWKELRKARSLQKVYFDLPQYQLTHGVFIWADKACLGGSDDQMILPIGKKDRKKCVEWGSSSDNDGQCVRYETVYPRIAVSGTRYGCIEWGNNDSGEFTCLQYGQKEYSYNTNFMVNIYKNTRNSDSMHDQNNRGRKLFTKNLVLPLCVDVD